MSTKRYRQMIEDRNLRDAALALVKADIEHVRGDMSVKGIGERMVGRASDGALEVFEEAAEVAENNRGILATLVAAIVIWFAKNPIMSLFSDEESDDAGDEHFDAEPDLEEAMEPAEPPAR